DFTHDGKLLEVLGAAVHIGADVNQYGRAAAGGGHDRGQSRALHAGQAAEHELAGGHDGAGVAGADQADGAAGLDEAGADMDGGVALGADGANGAFDFGRGGGIAAHGVQG